MARGILLVTFASVALATAGCRTVGTAGGKAGEVAADTARAAGNAAATAVGGAGEIIEDTAKAADDEMR